MAGEGCNINKDEAEVLKPSSSSSPPSHPSPPPPPPPPPPSPPPPAAAQPSSLFLKPLHPHEFPIPDRPDRSSEASPPLTAAAPLPRLERERQSVPFGDRCSSCRKRVRLTGFRCRCGDLFCARHRHSDTHDCSFDYKTTGRELIAKANPLIRAAKIIKI